MGLSTESNLFSTMPLALFRSAMRPSISYATAVSRPVSTIPIGKVARVGRFHVKDEESAVKMDEIIKSTMADVDKYDPPIKGYLGTNRTVCKSEWAYEVAVIFDNLDNFKAYMEHPQREAVVAKVLPQMKALMKDPEAMYLGNRVWDDKL